MFHISRHLIKIHYISRPLSVDKCTLGQFHSSTIQRCLIISPSFSRHKVQTESVFRNSLAPAGKVVKHKTELFNFEILKTYALFLGSVANCTIVCIVDVLHHSMQHSCKSVLVYKGGTNLVCCKAYPATSYSELSPACVC